MHSRVEAIIFDLYGTLVRVTAPAVARGFPRLLDTGARPWMNLVRGRLLTSSFADRAQLVRFVCDQFRVGRGSEVEARCLELVDHELSSGELVPGVQSLLAFLKRRGYTLGLLSNLTSVHKEPSASWITSRPRRSPATPESRSPSRAPISICATGWAWVVSEVALAIPLLVGAGLFIRSFQKLTTLDPGFDPERLLTLRIGLSESPAGAPDSSAGSSMVPRLLEGLQSVPGAEAVSFASDAPLAGEGGAIFYTAEGQPPATAQTHPRAYVHRVTPGFFRTLGARLVHGRDFTRVDLESRSSVVIVSEGVARRFWPGGDPVGKRIRSGGASRERRGSRSSASWTR